MEEKIENTIELPEQLAEYGEVKMDRTSVMKIVGDLFDFRMNVNLISNVLDIPGKKDLKGGGWVGGWFCMNKSQISHTVTNTIVFCLHRTLLGRTRTSRTLQCHQR